MKAILRSINAAAVLLLLSVAPAAAQFVIMPDSTNNRLVAFNPFDGSVINSNMFSLAGGTPIHALQVGNEIWVSEQIGDRISRWSLSGTFLGEIGGAAGGMDNIRGMALIGDTVYVTNSGTANGAPGNAIIRVSLSGTILGNFSAVGLAPSPFGILEHQGGMLVSSSSANDDIHRFTLAGASLGTFHNSTSLNFAQQMAYATNGDVLAAGFSSNNVVRLDITTGVVVGSFAASGARGVFQLGNGNILWSNSAGVHVFDVTTSTSAQVYVGGGRYLQNAPVPEPSTYATLVAGAMLFLGLRRWVRRKG
ncbi:hypothetical protein BH20VER1_BH20VER1_05610 [soil metagenome]